MPPSITQIREHVIERPKWTTHPLRGDSTLRYHVIGQPLMQFYEIFIYQLMIFRLYTANNKHEMIKIGDKTREKSQILSQELE